MPGKAGIKGNDAVYIRLGSCHKKHKHTQRLKCPHIAVKSVETASKHLKDHLAAVLKLCCLHVSLSMFLKYVGLSRLCVLASQKIV